MSDAQLIGRILIAVLSFGFLLAVAIAIIDLSKRSAKYRAAWKRELEIAGLVRADRAQLAIENTGLRAEVIRLKRERDKWLGELPIGVKAEHRE